MKKALRTSFSSLREEIDILSKEDCITILGGQNDQNGYATDSDGYLYISSDGGNTWERLAPIGEVVIPPPPSQGPIGGGQSFDNLWASGGISSDYFAPQ